MKNALEDFVIFAVIVFFIYVTYKWALGNVGQFVWQPN